MATYTDNYNLTKPTFAESADIRTINGNMDTIDDVLHASQISLADAYDETRTSENPYNTGDIVMYELLMYKCLEDGVYGTWDGTKWERTTAGANGGGSDVEVTPSYNSGTKIAEIDVDGNTEEIYVPEMTGASSQADGTAGLPPAPEAGDEDKFLRGDGTWAEAGGGTDYVELTQAEYNALTPEEKENGTLYFITDGSGGGGGGSTVIPNPIGEPTEILNTVGINNIIYNIPGSGGGAGGSVTTLYTGTQREQTISLSDSLNNYDVVIISFSGNNSNDIYRNDMIYNAKTLSIGDNIGCTDDISYLWYEIVSMTSLSFHSGGGTAYYIKNIVGLKFGSSGSGGGYELDNLYHNSTTTSETNISLANSFKTYDDIILLVDRYADNTVYKLQYRYSADSINISDKLSVMGWSSNTEYLTYVIQSETSLTLNASGNNNLVLTDVIGVNYGSGGSGGGSGDSEDISNMTWTQIISQVGGDWSTATAIPNNATHVAVVVDYDNKVYMPQTFKISDWDKYADTLSHSLVEWEFDWKVGSSYDTVQIEYDSANHTIRTYAGYSGITLKTYALS